MLAQAAGEEPVLGAEFCIYTDNDFNLAAIQWSYGCFLINWGEITLATSLTTDSLQRFRKRGNHAFIADCLNTLYGGNGAEARRLLEEGLRIALDVENSDYLGQACMYLAEFALWEEDADQAAHWLGQSLAYQAVRKRLTIDELQRLFIAARLLTLQEQYQHAATLLGLIEVEHRRIYCAYQGPMLPLVNAARTTVRAALGVEAFDEAFAAGQHLSLGEAYSAIEIPS